ncbi:putative formin binding protein [Aspergillus clavatus NRRL 1]|uniref:U1 zinc finger domain protein n=1 Tax=Aspergillus clavatus (strain ATCC 1007 / CBS 513.65 / DSM 816 / NCTC 3887 / NRRL 1 / QM 1276 / 107) TaxID=344612 RepID=A1CIB3_ASPCL|nr:U1 zinc finger domain protein [Aspergillus clavatus NRRL 1]EAW10618.1 U1 zinc finger domain protein [Aspergillus clavatus NRRL 1]
MAEYWKSAPRFWCKQCKIFIRDTPFEKTQHEASGKHQGNLKRFLRDIHRDNERKQRESQRAKNEVERLRQSVAGPSGAKESDGAPWKRTPAVAPPSERPVSVEERKKQMAQLAEMGVAIPDQYRTELALAGEWETISERVIRSGDAEEGKAETSVGVRKRKLEGEGDEEEQEAKREAERFVSQAWGSRTRRYPGEQSDTDLDALLESTKDIKKAKISTPETEPTAQATEGTAPTEEAEPKPEPGSVKEAEASEPPASTTPAVKQEEGEATPGVVFKKRKPKVLRK